MKRITFKRYMVHAENADQQDCAEGEAHIDVRDDEEIVSVDVTTGQTPGFTIVTARTDKLRPSRTSSHSTKGDEK